MTRLILDCNESAYAILIAEVLRKSSNKKIGTR